MNQISALNNPRVVDMPLNNPKGVEKKQNQTRFKFKSYKLQNQYA